MAITIDGTTGITTPGLVNTGTESVVGLTTTGNTILGDASTDTLNVGNGGLVKDASGNVGIGTISASLFNSVGGSTRLAVCGSSASTDILGNTNASICIINTDTTANNTAGLHFARADTDDTPNLAGASIVAQFPDTQVTNQYPKGLLAFLTSTNANAAPSEKMRIDSSGNLLVGTTSPILNSVLSIAQRNSTGNGSSTLTLDHLYANNKYINFGWYGTTIGSISQSSGTSIVINSPALTFQTGSIDRMIVDSSGNLLVGTPSQFGSGKVCVSYDGTVYNGVALRTTNAALNSNFVTFYNSATTNCGGISQNGTTTVNYITSSDYRLKENIAPMIGALDKVVNLNPVTYIWKDTNNEVGEGFIAHELQAICPLAVSGEKDAVNEDGSIKAQGIDPSKLVALLTASIQELKVIIDTQNDTINNLTTRLETLEGAV